MKFVFNDENIENSHGFFLLNKGGDFTRFKKNPVMLYLHDQNNLIGRWSKLIIEGSTLVAEPEFDTEDELAIKLKQKVDRGFLKGCSPGIRIMKVKLIDEKVYATKWELMESSLVPVPSGSASLVLYTKEGKQLKDSEVKNYLNLCLSGNANNNNNNNNMELILFTSLLGLKSDASETDVIDAVKKVISEKQQAEAKLAAKDEEIAKLESKLKVSQDAKVKALIDKAIADKKIDETLRATYTTLAETDYEGCKAALEAIKGVSPVKQELGANGAAAAQAPEAEKNWTYKDYVRNNKAEELKVKNFERFKELYKLEYNREYQG